MLDYYAVAGKASQTIDRHPGLLYLQELCRQGGKVLDVGCGEGSRLHTLLGRHGSGWGIDLNQKAICLARRRYPQYKFQLADAQANGLPADYFDVVYSAFALEHCQDPDRFISEMFRVCKPGGQVVILCPNFGAPVRRSPVSTQNKALKFLAGFFRDLFPPTGLNWRRVIPSPNYTVIDSDTTIEPYLLSLVRYLRHHRCRIIQSSSLWVLADQPHDLFHYFLKYLGSRGLPPVTYWGPQMFVAASKPS